MASLALTSSPSLQEYPLLKNQIQRPDSNDYVSYNNFINTIQVPPLHAHVLKTGLISDIYTSNTLISRYSKQGLISDAHYLFDEMSERDLISWTSLISGYTRLGKHNKALEIFIQMLNNCFCPNEFAFGSILRACTESGHSRFGTQLHGLIVKTGFAQNEFVDSGLITMYSRSGDFDIANGILLRMYKKDAFSWTSMVVGYSNGGCSLEAIILFAQMMEEDIQPSKYTLTSVLKACLSLDGVEEGYQVHGYVLKVGFEEDVSIRVSLIDLYSKMGDLPSARLIYDMSTVRDVILCTAMIGGSTLNGRPELAIEIFTQMRENFELLPNEFTFSNVISTCAELGDTDLGASLHAIIIKTGHASVVHVEGALINLYAKNGNMRAACKVFNNMVDKDTVSCSSILTGFSLNGYYQEALEFYSTLHQLSMKSDPFAIASATVSCAKLSDQIRGKQIHAQVIKHGHQSDTCIASALVDMYAKSGTIEDAHCVFDNLLWRDRIAWTAMIDGYAQHGQGWKALESFERMIKDSIQPNDVTFVSVLYACSHAGLVEEGLHHFQLMSSCYGIKPILHHYACVVDLLGRAGQLQEALEFITTMPIEPTPLVWRAFMGACRIHNNLKLAIYASKRLLKMDPDDDSAYVLLANMYAAAGRWSESSLVRNAMRKRGVKKVPGLSWIEVGKQFHVFLARDSVHPQKELIYKVLDDLNPEMKKAGYVPETGVSNMQDMDEEEEEGEDHSEELAVGLGT